MLQNILLYGELAAGVYLIFMTMIIEVNKNVKSKIIVKFIPFIFGLLLVLDFLFRIGIMIVKH
jgi:hypothetical protein